MRAKRARRAVKQAPKPKVVVNYGRRVRNVLITHNGESAVMSFVVKPGEGPKPKVYPKVDYTPHSWRIGAAQDSSQKV